MDHFFEEVDEEELYAITLAEENVFWNGQSDRLEPVYRYVKQNHQVPVYQWYTPSHTSSIPGLNYPNLKADGWMADEYFLQQPLIEKAMRGYTVLQKPVFQLMWALPQIHAVPSAETTFWEQYAACRKYNIPVAFYFWVGVGEGPIHKDGVWDPAATPIMRRIFEDYCIHGGTLARRLAAQTAGSCHGPWRLSHSPELSIALPNRFWDWLGVERLLLKERVQRTEPPYTDPCVRWCGSGAAAAPPPIPISQTDEVELVAAVGLQPSPHRLWRMLPMAPFLSSNVWEQLKTVKSY